MNSIRMAIYIVFGFTAIVLATLVFIQKNALDTVEAELAMSRAANVELTKTVETLVSQRVVDDRIVTEFTKGLAELKTATEYQTKAISELEKNDPAVKNFLSVLLPTSLSDLLNDATAPGGHTPSTP